MAQYNIANILAGIQSLDVELVRVIHERVTARMTAVSVATNAGALVTIGRKPHQSPPNINMREIYDLIDELTANEALDLQRIEALSAEILTFDDLDSSYSSSSRSTSSSSTSSVTEDVSSSGGSSESSSSGGSSQSTSSGSSESSSSTSSGSSSSSSQSMSTSSQSVSTSSSSGSSASSSSSASTSSSTSSSSAIPE